VILNSSEFSRLEVEVCALPVDAISVHDAEGRQVIIFVEERAFFFVFSAVEDKEGNSKVVFRHYRTEFKKTGTKLPHVSMNEAGPRFTLAVDRVRVPMPERWKMALKTPKELKPKKQKNVTTNMLGQRVGRVHVGRQEIDKMHIVHHGSRAKRKFGETRAEIAA